MKTPFIVKSPSFALMRLYVGLTISSGSYSNSLELFQLSNIGLKSNDDPFGEMPE